MELAAASVRRTTSRPRGQASLTQHPCSLSYNIYHDYTSGASSLAAGQGAPGFVIGWRPEPMAAAVEYHVRLSPGGDFAGGSEAEEFEGWMDSLGPVEHGLTLPPIRSSRLIVVRASLSRRPFLPDVGISLRFLQVCGPCPPPPHTHTAPQY